MLGVIIFAVFSFIVMGTLAMLGRWVGGLVVGGFAAIVVALVLLAGFNWEPFWAWTVAALIGVAIWRGWYHLLSTPEQKARMTAAKPVAQPDPLRFL